MPVDFYSVRLPYATIAATAQGYIYPLSSLTSWETRELGAERTITVGITLTRQVAAGTAAEQIASQDEMLQLCEQIEEWLLDNPDYTGANARWGLMEISAGETALIEPAPADHEGDFVRYLAVEFYEVPE